jgi:hypothetical protein
MEISDADTTPLEGIGVKGAVLEKLLSAEVFTVGQLAVWLRGHRLRPIHGVGREQIAKLSDLLVDYQIKRTPKP